MVETWDGFSTAMRDHFVNPHDITEDLPKMDKLMYARNINDYIIQMDALNYRIGSSGVRWHQIMKEGLPSEIVDRMTYRAVEPSDTTQVIGLLRRAEKRYEEKRLYHHPKSGEAI